MKTGVYHVTELQYFIHMMTTELSPCELLLKTMRCDWQLWEKWWTLSYSFRFFNYQLIISLQLNTGGLYNYSSCTLQTPYAITLIISFSLFFLICFYPSTSSPCYLSFSCFQFTVFLLLLSSSLYCLFLTLFCGITCFCFYFYLFLSFPSLSISVFPSLFLSFLPSLLFCCFSLRHHKKTADSFSSFSPSRRVLFWPQ